MTMGEPNAKAVCQCLSCRSAPHWTRQDNSTPCVPPDTHYSRKQYTDDCAVRVLIFSLAMRRGIENP